MIMWPLTSLPVNRPNAVRLERCTLVPKLSPGKLVPMKLLICDGVDSDFSVQLRPKPKLKYLLSISTINFFRDRSPRERKSWDYKDKGREKDVSFHACFQINKLCDVQGNNSNYAQGSDRGNSSNCNDWTEHKSSSGKKYYYNRFVILIKSIV